MERRPNMLFKVVREESRFSFEGAIRIVEEKVNKLLKEGWELSGNLQIAVQTQSSYYVVYQALIKKTD